MRKRYIAHGLYVGQDANGWVIRDTNVPDPNPGLNTPNTNPAFVASELSRLDAIALAERMNREVEAEARR